MKVISDWHDKRRLAWWDLCRKHLPPDDCDRLFGQECGIPECCIDFFVNSEKPVAIKARKKYGRPLVQNTTRNGSPYVMCPECRKKVGVTFK